MAPPKSNMAGHDRGKGLVSFPSQLGPYVPRVTLVAPSIIDRQCPPNAEFGIIIIMILVVSYPVIAAMDVSRRLQRFGRLKTDLWPLSAAVPFPGGGGGSAYRESCSC